MAICANDRRRTISGGLRATLSIGAVLLALSALPGSGAGAPMYTAGDSTSDSTLGELCGYPYPAFTRFVVEDGGLDPAGNPLRMCTEYLRWGGEKTLGLPISRPFRVGADLYQAFEVGVLGWRSDYRDTVPADVLDIMHTTGRDPALQRLGVPPAQNPNIAWLTDPALSEAYGNTINPIYGLPTSAPTQVGSYVIQRYQRGLMRRWAAPAPYDLNGMLVAASRGYQVERMYAGDVLRFSGLIPSTALVADRGTDPQQYNWSAAPVVPEAFWTATSHAVGGWDSLFHRVGAFAIGVSGSSDDAMIGEVDQAKTTGLSLAVNGYIGRDSRVVQAALDRNLTLIDTYPWGRIAAVCGNAAVLAQNCSLSQAQLDSLDQDIRHHLVITRQDDSVVGFWVLDDYPGDVRPAIELIHTLVTLENLVDRVARPTICGFGGNLDDTQRSDADSRAAFDAAVKNFTPTGCDAVALYPYAAATGRALSNDSIDWSMTDLLPYMLARLQEQGWDPARQPLIGVPQTFRSAASAAPYASDVALQAAAYCAAGSSTVMLYAWNDGSGNDVSELFNSEELRRGAQDGIAQCQALWNSTVSGSPR